MPRERSEKAVFQCVDPFVVWNKGVPEVYGPDRMVLDGDPILRSHGRHFQSTSERVERARQVEKATAAPGERRTVSTQPHTAKEPHRGEEE